MVTGSEHWDLLRLYGVTTEFGAETSVIRTTGEVPAWSVSADDLARGLLVYADRPADLRRWATVLLGADCFDFEALERHVAGTELLEALWDAAGGAEPSPTARAGALDLVNERGKAV